MRIFSTIILILCTISAYSQNNTMERAEQKASGSYSFQSATVKAYNYDTKAEVFTHVFNDILSLNGLKELPFPVQPVFLSAIIQQGVLSSCTLWNNMKDYNVTDNGTLLIPTKEYDSDRESENGDVFSHPYRLSPLYSLVTEGNTATFTFNEVYGNSLYNFTLEGKFIITLVRD